MGVLVVLLGHAECHDPSPNVLFDCNRIWVFSNNTASTGFMTKQDCSLSRIKIFPFPDYFHLFRIKHRWRRQEVLASSCFACMTSSDTL